MVQLPPYTMTITSLNTYHGLRSSWQRHWLRVVDAHNILGVSGFLFYWPNDVWFNVQDSNQIQQYFSSEKELTLWCALPALEELQTAWEKKHDNPKYTLYKDALSKGPEKIRKYYSQLDDKPSFMLVLGKYFFLFQLASFNINLFSSSSILQASIHQIFMGWSKRASCWNRWRECRTERLARRS